MTYLCLDCAAWTGWAFGGPGLPPETGRCRLPKTGADVGAFVNAFRDWLVPFCEQHAPEQLVYETPLLQPGKTSEITVRKLNGLGTMVESVADDLGIRCREANLSSIRKHFIGVARAPRTVKGDAQRRNWIKARVIERCRERGWDPANDDEADALAILDFVMSADDPNYGAHSTPLFEGLMA